MNVYVPNAVTLSPDQENSIRKDLKTINPSYYVREAWDSPSGFFGRYVENVQPQDIKPVKAALETNGALSWCEATDGWETQKTIAQQAKTQITAWSLAVDARWRAERNTRA